MPNDFLLPDWSPDGKQLTYHRELIAAGEVTTAGFTLNADGTGEKRLTEPDLVAGAPAYSPDGEWIVFTAVTSSSRSLWAIPSDGGTPAVIADDEAIGTHGTWQPSG